MAEWKIPSHLPIRGRSGIWIRKGQVLSGIEKKIVLPESVEAPVQEGEAVGEAVYLLNGNRIGSVSIVTGQTVDKAVYKDYLQKVWRMFYTV